MGRVSRGVGTRDRGPCPGLSQVAPDGAATSSNSRATFSNGAAWPPVRLWVFLSSFLRTQESRGLVVSVTMHPHADWTPAFAGVTRGTIYHYCCVQFAGRIAVRSRIPRILCTTTRKNPVFLARSSCLLLHKSSVVESFRLAKPLVCASLREDPEQGSNVNSHAGPRDASPWISVIPQEHQPRMGLNNNDVRGHVQPFQGWR